MFDYQEYLLKDNPFPVTAVVDPYDQDPRVNGAIFQDTIFKKETKELREKTARRTNLIYISGIEHVKGIGKSALMINHWRECRLKPESTALYIKLDLKDKTRNICIKILEAWHNEETLWKAFQKIFTSYSETQSNPMLQTDSVQYLFEKHPKLCQTLPLTRYTQIRDTKTLADKCATYLQTKLGVNPNNVSPLLEKYLTNPASYPDTLNKRSVDPVAVFKDILKLLIHAGYKHHYVFLDQFEDMIMGTTKRGIGKLSLELKNMLIAAKRNVSFYVTLHPNSEMQLRIPSANVFTGIAPIDTIHRVNVMVLDKRGDQAVQLTKAYFDYYRTKEPPYSTYPIQEDLVNFICYLQEGNIRALLQQLYNCIEYGTIKELEEITLKYALEHPLDILGREISSKQLKRYQNNRK